MAADASATALAHPAYNDMRLVVEALATGPGSIHERLRAAEPHFGRVHASGNLGSEAEDHLRMRIGAGLVEAAADDDSDDERLIGKWIGELDEPRAVEIAEDMVRLYELVAGLRNDDGYGLKQSRST
jgi:hypothetical protein